MYVKISVFTDLSCMDFQAFQAVAKVAAPISSQQPPRIISPFSTILNASSEG